MQVSVVCKCNHLPHFLVYLDRRKARNPLPAIPPNLAVIISGYMRLLLILMLISFNSFGQEENYLIDFKIQKIFYKGDSIQFETPKAFEIKTPKTSDIKEIGRINDTQFGVHFEILKSDLENESKFICGRVYYFKTSNSDWKKIVNFGHSAVTVDNISKRKENEKILEDRIRNAKNERIGQLYMQGNTDTSGDPVVFGIYYKINYYKK